MMMVRPCLEGAYFFLLGVRGYLCWGPLHDYPFRSDGGEGYVWEGPFHDYPFCSDAEK